MTHGNQTKLSALFFPALLLGLSSTALATPAAIEEQELKQYLKDFYQNSVETMNRLPSKRDSLGKRIDHVETPFGADSVKDQSFLMARDQVRAHLNSNRVSALFAGNDLVENLVEVDNIVRNLKVMEDSSYLSRKLDIQPWSDSYWPLNRGMTADRYADPGFPSSNDWTRNLDYITGAPAPSLIAGGLSGNLAPSEKYDYLMGNDDYTLTQRSWDIVRNLQTVASWAGICDGWSASAITNPEPLHKITVTGSAGRTIDFYPSDVKGLSALLWAKGKFPTSFIGSRCTIKDPARDEVGRTIAPECRDSNPGTWHMSVVNQLGQAGRPLIIDATYDYEIWNYPVWEYHYSYFNPQTLKPVTNWQDAIVPVDRFTIDKFKKYRSADTKYVAGISMIITYMVELTPSHAQGHRSSARSVHYVYDVELDSSLNIIDGEWYSNIHPDFIWTPRVGAKVVSVGDSGISDPSQWTGSAPPPDDWIRFSRIASQNLQPLAAIVNRLIQLSHDGTPP